MAYFIYDRFLLVHWFIYDSYALDSIRGTELEKECSFNILMAASWYSPN